MDSLTHLFVGLRWQDLIDIVLNSYILFRLYVLFQGTNVFRMAITIAFLWLVERMAVAMGLIVTSWAMQGIIAAGALIVIIVFRNEIAEVFQHRSLKSIFWGFPRHQVHSPIAIIVESVRDLANHKLGGLLVLPMKKDIESLVHGGVPWHGKLSREMILSIFWNGTPVHDGAAIIQDDRIVEVAAILPLSKRTDLPSHFGTRHRAAAGLAERTDALIIVVSEERSEITVFKDDAIVHTKDNFELERILCQLTGTALAQSGGLQPKTQLKVAAFICLTVITGVWFNFARGLETLVTLEAPIEFINRDPRMEIFSASTSSVKLQLSGSGLLVKSIRSDQIKVQLNLANAIAGSNQIAIARDSIVLPPGLQLKQVEPEALEVNLDIPVTKTLPIQADWTGKLPANLLLTSIRLQPASAVVIGGSQTLKDIETIFTEKIPLETITSSGKVSVGLVLSPSSLKLMDESKNRIEMNYVLAQRPPSGTDESK